MTDKPIAVEAEVSQGEALLRAGRRPEAADAFKRALQRQPQHVPALAGLGSALLALNQLEPAEASSRKALALAPHTPAALRVLAAVLQLTGRHREGLELADATLAAQPDHGEAWLARGDSLANLGQLDEALVAYETARGDETVTFEALVRRARLQGALGRPEAATALFDAALRLNPDAATPRFQRGTLRLSLRRFADGWDDYEARWASTQFVATARGIVPQALVPNLATRVSAAALRDKRVMVIGEQGVGDQLMFASMLPDLAKVAREVTCVCEPRLVKLLASSLDGVTVLDPRTAQVDTDALDVVMAIGSLGFAFRRSAEDFPGTPYLRPGAPALARWSSRLGPREGRLRVGLSWRGGLPSTRREARSLPLDQLRPLLDLPDCEFVSLQYGDVTAEVAAASSTMARPIRLFPSAEIDDFEDLAALTAQMDLVVSVQTALVHLAGGLGVACLTLAPTTPVWRYGASGETMPWYGSVRLLRQSEPGDWAAVVGQVLAAVRARLD